MIGEGGEEGNTEESKFRPGPHPDGVWTERVISDDVSDTNTSLSSVRHGETHHNSQRKRDTLVITIFTEGVPVFR